MSCFFKFYNSLQFMKVSCATRQHVFSRLSINSEFFLFKIVAPGEGRKPSREEYVAVCFVRYPFERISNDTFPFRFQWTTRKEAELINIFNCRYCQTEIAFTRMLGDSLVQPCVHNSEFGEHSQESLKVMVVPVPFYDSNEERFMLFSSEFPTEHVNHRKIRCTHCLIEAVT